MNIQNQLVSYIALGAPATRRPATGDLPYLRPEIGFTPNWYHKAINIDFGEKWHTNPAYRKQAVLEMRNEIDSRFPDNKIGRISDDKNDLDILTGLYGACSIAAIYDVPFRYEKDQWPTSEHFSIPEDQMQNLLPPDLTTNSFYQSIIKQVDWIAENQGKVHGFMNWQGVLNNAQRIRGQELFMDMLINPEGTKNLLNSVCKTMIDAAKTLQDKQKQSGINYSFFTVSNCLVNMLSPELYQEFILPFDKQIADSFKTIGIHNCAWNANPYLEDYASVPKVGYIDMGIESDLDKARTLFPKTRRSLMYTPMDLANKSFNEIRNDLELIAQNYGPCDIVIADIEHGTPDKKIMDAINICEEISNKYL
ncbi:MAG: hypothetical protein HQ522_19710 [Bacteroidetes bacterium]|nr:hypothetical protein [Bacteroidota bacterium]